MFKPLAWFQWLRPVVGLFPFTKTGIAFIALFGVAVWLYGIRRMDFVALAAGFAGALTIFVLLVCALTCASFLFFASRRAVTAGGSLDLSTNLPQSTGYHVRCPLWIPCVVAGWSWENAGRVNDIVSVARDKNRLVETVTPARRRIADRVARRFYVRDIFGLTEISWRRTETINLRVLPDRGMLTQMPPPVGMADGDDVPDPWAAPSGDRVDMRPYVPGDPLRTVLWKIYARSGRMMVRIPERSVSERRKGCGYLVIGNGDDAASAVARIVVERGLLGDDWRFGSDGVANYASETDEALEIIAVSGDVDSVGRAKNHREVSGLGSFIAKMRSDGFQSCVLFLPPDPASWDYVSRQTAGVGSMRIQVVIGVEGLRLEHDSAQGLTRRAADWFLRPATGSDPTLEEIKHMVSSAPGLCKDVKVAERRIGNLHRNFLLW